MRATLLLVVAATIGLTGVSVAIAQRADAFGESRDHPAIAYSTAPVATAIDDLNRTLADGRARLAFDETSGYLRSVLAGFLHI